MSLFVTIEGVEGAGKSTLRARLNELLPSLVSEVVTTREPGATTVGASIRTLLLDPASQMTPMTELMLFCADRAQHLAEVVRPALDRGALVLCDRFIHSTLAYQGFGRGMNLDSLWQLTRFVTADMEPDLVLILDLPAEHGLKRAEHRARRASGSFPIDRKSGELSGTAAQNAEWTRFEEQDIAFHRRVREGFLALAKGQPNCTVLDASEEAECLAQTAFQRIRQALAHRKSREAK